MFDQIENKEEIKLISPILVLTKLKKIILGTKEPETLIKVTFYVNIIVWFIFQTWHILSYFAINYRDIILQEKKVNIEILILNRGAELGIDPSVFLEKLNDFHLFATACWLTIVIGIILMWRTHKNFIYFIFAPIFIYIFGMFYFLGIDYYVNDTTFFDKFIYFLFIANSIFYYFIFKNSKEEKNSSKSFFDVE